MRRRGSGRLAVRRLQAAVEHRSGRHVAQRHAGVVRDVDVSSLTAYQRASSKALQESPVLLSIAHGEAMSPEFQEGFYDAVSAYVRTRDPDSFATDLENAVSRARIPQR